MRYIKPLGKVVYTGTQAMFSEIMRKQVPGKSLKPSNVNNEYPILMMHGFMGFSKMEIAGIKLFDYFNGVKVTLEQMGYTVVTPEVKPIDTPQNRATQWANHLDQLLSDTGASKAHIICHSQGCIDARVLAAPCENSCETPSQGTLNGKGYGDKIASMTHLGGPHLGTILADQGKQTPVSEFIMDIIELIALLTGSTPENAQKTIDMMRPDFMKEVFNEKIQVPDTIPCYTIAGSPANKSEVGFMFDSTWEKLMSIAPEDGGGDNDGFVVTDSAHFKGNNAKLQGTNIPQWQSLGNIHADHVAMIGIPIEFNDNTFFRHLPMFVGIAQHVDACYIKNVQMALQTDGEWVRSCSIHQEAVEA